MSDVWSTGTREVWRLTLASGRTITATANHPLRTVHGWCPVEGLAIGDFLATTRASDAPDSPKTWPDNALRDSRSNPDIDIDIIPPAAWDYVRKAMRAAGVTTRQLAELLEMSHCGSALYKAGLSRVQMARVAAAVPEPFLRDLATSDVRWDRITAIEPAGSEEVFDAHVPGTHSFLANDVVSHNSGAIEQDADVVILLHREDVYERESPRAGEADLIVAKHRNGPTDTLIVAFQGHYSRFVDMAPG
jgi:replicative DNA helicase